MTVQRDHAGGAKPTTLSGSLSNSATAFTVTTGGGTGYPDGTNGAFIVTIDAGLAGEEKILCAARAGDSFTVTTRGYDGTSATAHSNLAIVEHTFSAIEAQEANDHIRATTSVHGIADTSALATTASLAGFATTAALAGVAATIPTLPLTQAQSHASPDTDTATTSLHHTLGTGADQAAAGNHTHAGGGGGTAANPAFLGLITPEKMGAGSQTLGVNVAVYMKFKPLVDISVTLLKTYISASAGNLDVGIYSDSAGSPNTRLASTGSFASSTGLLSKTISSTALTAGTVYWLAMAMSSTANFPAQTYVAAALADAVRMQNSAFPLPATATPVTSTLTSIPPLYIVT